MAADGGIQYAVVSIPGISKGKPFAEAKPTLDQKGCEYMPHITVVQAGGEVEVLNSDGILHNIHSYPQESKNAPVNVAQPKFKKTIVLKERSLKQPERTLPARAGWIGLADRRGQPIPRHPDQTVSQITEVPPGTTRSRLAEKSASATQKVTLNRGRTAATSSGPASGAQRSQSTLTGDRAMLLATENITPTGRRSIPCYLIFWITTILVLVQGWSADSPS